MRTVEGLAEDGVLHPMQEAFAHHAPQRGFCTPGIPDAGGRRARAQSRDGRGGAARGLRPPLPLHRLPEHPEGGERSGRRCGDERLSACSVPPARGRLPPPPATGTVSPADIESLPVQLHMRVVRSPVAARQAPGHRDSARRWPRPASRRCGRAADVADVPPIHFRATRVRGLGPDRQPMLARGRGRYVGEPVAVVFADDRLRRRGRGEVVFGEIDDPPPCLDPTASPSHFDEGLPTEPDHARKATATWSGLRHDVIELDLRIGRHSGAPIETRGAVGRVYRATRVVLELHGAARLPHANRRAARRHPRPGRSSALHLDEGDVGGGFGIRGEIYPEDALVALAARPPRSPGENGSRTVAST